MKRSAVLLGLLSLAAPLAARDYLVNPMGQGFPGAQVLATVAELNKLSLQPGDRVYFMGGITHTAGVVIRSSGTQGKPILLSGYGKQPAILAPASASESALRIVNSSHITVKDLVFAGPGRDKSLVSGVHLLNDGSKAQGGIQIEGCEVRGFEICGLLIQAQGKFGWKGVRVTKSSFHHNRDMGVHSTADWLQSPRPNGDFYFGHCKFYSNWGKVDSKNNMGGMVLMGVSGALVERCEAYDNGGDYPYGGGVFGVWCWSADHVVMQFNESHHNRQNGKSSDGGGYDLDGATTDSLVQYNYSHDNDGAGVLLAQFPSASLSGPFKNNTVRYNVSVRDAQRGEYGALAIWGGSPKDHIGKSEFYNNSIFVGPALRGGKPSAVGFIDSNQKDVSFYNNVFYVTAGLPLIKMPGRGDNGSVVFKRNVYFTEGGGFRVEWDERRYSSLAAWAGAGRGKQEQENGQTLGLFVDPQWRQAGASPSFSDPALYTRLYDYMLKPGSPLRDQGLDLNKREGLIAPPGKRDYYGYPVPAGAGWDIGAHEFPAAASR